MKRVMLTVLLVAALLLALGGSVSAAPPPDNPGKAPDSLTKIVFVHYPRGVEAKGGIPGPPDGGGGAAGDKEGRLWYKYSGIHWAVATVDYLVEDDDVVYIAAIDASFDTWEATGASVDFEYAGTFDGVPSSFDAGGSADLRNEIGWTSLSASYPNAIAVTAVWVYTGTTIIAEVDMAMNSDLPWVQNTGVSDPNSEKGDKTAYDVQNIVTHEAGHWLLLGDLYNKPAREQTMYGYGATGELKKRSLESGDIAGILVIYPAP